MESTIKLMEKRLMLIGDIVASEETESASNITTKEIVQSTRGLAESSQMGKLMRKKEKPINVYFN